MIRVQCRTNIVNEYQHEIWPIEMVARPIVGDTVRSESGKQLEVCRVVHCQPRGRAMNTVDSYPAEPYLEVELTKASLWHTQH